MPRSRRDSAALSLAIALAAAWLGACASEDGRGREDEREVDAGPAAQPKSERPTLCERPGNDEVRDLFCGPEPAKISDLADLQQQLGVVFSVTNGAEPYRMLGIVQLLGHSTALSGHLASPINPRVIMPSATLALAFQRGVQRVEIFARDRDEPRRNFYLLAFEQACNASKHGCGPGDLYTPSIERAWESVAIADDEDLKNTPSDCRRCHQPERERPLVLLMRELRAPWTHFFLGERLAPALGQAPPADPPVPSGLLLDYLTAKGDELYANVPAYPLRNTQPGVLQVSVDPSQPLEFDSMTIHSERVATGLSGMAARSETWDRMYAAFKRGASLPPPHFDERVTDPDKQAALSEAYQRYLRKEIDADELPDLSDIYPDEPQTRAEIGLQTEPSATPAEALIQACGSCHNDVLDQSISRARFSIALARMSRAELDLAIERLQLPPDDPRAMPPREARQLDDPGRKALITYLKQADVPEEDLSLLQGAASLGMAGSGLE